MSKKSLRDSLSRWNVVGNSRHTLEPSHTLRASAEITRVLGDERYRKPADYDLSSLYQRISQAWQRYHSLSGSNQIEGSMLDWISFYEQIVSKLRVPVSRDLRRIPWILFYSPHENTALRGRPRFENFLGADALFLKCYTQWLSECGSTSSIKTLMCEFLYVYPIDLPTFDNLRVYLHSRIVGETVQKTISLQKWQQRCQQFNLLEMKGDYLFIKNLVSSEESAQEILYQSGFEGRLARSNFLESGIHVYLPEICELLRKNHLGSAQFDRLAQILEYEDGLRFDNRSMRRKIALSLLEPFVEENFSHGVRDHLNSFFMRHYGDPRLPSGKPNWSGIPRKFRLVVTRWLAQHAFDAFFRLIEETALDCHWSYRQKFWQAYFDNNVIYDAWFVLGSSALEIISSMSEDGEYSHGILRGAGREQSVLLLRMHGATVAEWSHSGACRIWLDGNNFSPQLHREDTPYYGSELRKGADFVQRHFSSKYGGWQDQIAFWLEEHMDLEVSREEYLGIRRNVKLIQPQKEILDLTKSRQADLNQGNQSAIVTLTSAAKRGNVEAQYDLGSAYWTGEGLKQDHTKAIHWWRKAAKQGHTEARYRLGQFRRGKPPRVLKERGTQKQSRQADLNQGNQSAIVTLTSAAKRGNVEAQYDLGSAYWTGEGLKQDHTKAIHWWRKAAKQGHTEARYRLGQFRRGKPPRVLKERGTQKQSRQADLNQGNQSAIVTLTSAAKRGNVEAQ
ncbi:MAG: EH signature domain-containing protein, partial [Bacteroidetes bacterium]|nr:EH signature domain-containing protein [Bacteroidota bacterium]